jgi:hypothetical protein
MHQWKGKSYMEVQSDSILFQPAFQQPFFLHWKIPVSIVDIVKIQQ